MSERKKNYKSAYRSEKKKLYDNKENYKNKEKPVKKQNMEKYDDSRCCLSWHSWYFAGIGDILFLCTCGKG